MGLCDYAPACEVGHNHVKKCSVEKIDKAILNKDIHCKIEDGISFEEYVKNGGYNLLNKCYKNKISLDFIIDELDKSGLKGMGGAGFPAGQKWKFVRLEEGPRLMTINGDERTNPELSRINFI